VLEPMFYKKVEAKVSIFLQKGKDKVTKRLQQIKIISTISLV
jgi:tmRNA-binding protein